MYLTLRSENKIIQVSQSINGLNKVISYTNQWFVLYGSYVLIVIEGIKQLTNTIFCWTHTSHQAVSLVW